MSDHCTCIVPKISNYPNREEKAKQILSKTLNKPLTKQVTTSDITKKTSNLTHNLTDGKKIFGKPTTQKIRSNGAL